MNKREKEVLQAQLDAEKKVLKQLEKQYQAALDDINEKILLLQSKTVYDAEGIGQTVQVPLNRLTQSKIYQIEHQKALKGQIEGIIEKLHGDEYNTISQYLEDCYVNGFVGTAYDIAGQGIPLIMPIDQAAAVRAIQTESKISEGLYNALGVDTKSLKKNISQEVTRGIASGLTFDDISRNIRNVSNVPISNAKRIARTEGHRIQQASAYDAQQAAKKKGADVVKQWDSTLDGRTRPTHRRLDGQIREVDEVFEMDGKSAKYPGDFGDPGEDCNCRCASLTRAKWGLDEDELQTLKDRAAYFGLDKTEAFEDFKKKYLEAGKMAASMESDNDWSKAKPRTISKEDKNDAIAYAKEKGISLVDMKFFDGDLDLLKSGIDAISEVNSKYANSHKIVVGFSQSLSDADFASTVGSHITFNAKAFRTRAITEANIAKGNYFASSTLEDMCAHEYGHILLLEKGNKGLEIARKAYYNVFGNEADIDEVLDYLDRNVSPYSVSVDSETGKSLVFNAKKYKEIIPEVLAKENSHSDKFTKEFVSLLKRM